MSSSFSDLGVSAPVVDALARRGIDAPFEIQTLMMADALGGRDILARSRTGSGKTLAFGIAIVEQVDPEDKHPAALVLVPTRELSVQVAGEMSDVAAARDLRVATVYGGVPLDRQARTAARAHIVVATPGRLQDLLDRRLISLAHVRILVLDEADRMLDMGFAPQVDRIVRRLRAARQTMFLSATLEGQVGHLARAYTRNPARYEERAPKLVIEEADHRFVPVGGHERLDKLVAVLKEDRGLALVFVRTKRGADRLLARLVARGVPAVAMHGDMNQGARKRALARFTSGKVDVMIATDLAARGLDVEGITHVINYDPPQDYKGYVHRVGRTARAGRTGTGVTFVTPDQRQEMSSIARALELKREFQTEGLELAAPTRVFSSLGGRSMMRSRRPRRF